MTRSSLPRVGAPLVQAHLPLQGTPSARLQRWVQYHEERVRGMLERLTLRWELLASFVEINFLHPEVGPAGALYLVSSRMDGRMMKRRAARLLVIPHRELAPYLPCWQRGETVVVPVEDMPDELARRYDATPIHWSLNTPLMIEGQWAGLVGGAAGAEGFGRRSVAAFEALAQVMILGFEADSALCRFKSMTAPGKRFLQLLP